MEKYTNKYEVALAIAEKFGSTNANMSNIFEALLEIAQLKGLSVEGYSNKYEILKALAINEGVTSALSSSYDCLVGLASIYGGTNFSNNYEAALYLLENAEAGFGGLSFIAVSTGTIGMSHHGTNATTTIPRLQYSRDGETWTDWMFESLSVNTGDKIYFKGINNTISTSNTNYSNFAFTGSFKANGNIMSLLYGDDYKEKISLTGKDYCFYGLFYGTKGILTSPKLPATTLSSYCYAYMFNGTNLTTMPELPATTLTYRCYYNMFANCKSLTATTKLPAKKLVEDCYRGMFNECTSLNSVRADFNVMPTADYTEAWLNDVASEGTFYVASDAAWIDDVEFGPNTIPVGWTISGRVPHRNVNVTIDGVVYRLPSDQTFAQLGYTELYSQENYYPRFGQTAHDFTYNVNSHPMSGLELFTTCTPAVHMINVTVDGATTQVNYYTSWFANGFNELYANNEFESEEEVEEIDVDTTYPNEGDAVYTSYIIVKQWMKQVSAQTGIPVTNLKQAEDNYRFVDYLQSIASDSIMPLDNIADDTCGFSITFKRDAYFGDSVVFGSRTSTSTSSRFTIGSTTSVYFGWNSSLTIRALSDGEKGTAKLNYLNNRIGDVNGTTRALTTTLAAQGNNKVSLFGYTKAGEPTPTAQSWYVYNIEFTRGNSMESVYLPAINANGTPIMLDLMTMKEFENQGSEALITGAEKSLESKFNEMGYGLPQWMYDIAEQTGIPAVNIYNANDNYTFVDYLRSTGTQYIVTDITLQSTTKFETLTNILSSPTLNGALYRSGTTGSNYQFCHLGSTSAKIYMMSGGKDSSTAIVPNITVDNQYHKFTINKNVSNIFDGTTYSIGNKSSITAPDDICMNLFARNNNGADGATCGTQNAKYFIIEDTTAAHYFIPVINASNQAVMLDLSTMKEYANDGAGTFEYGDIKSLQEKFNEIL